MGKKYTEYKTLDLPAVANETLNWWEQHQIFEKSITSRDEKNPFVFFEGPPSANGLPGIHHVMARAIKDIFCRYKTLKGFQVTRKAGWDTHGLPVELGVEKELGITKEDIGKKITIGQYNKACREAVMRYTDIWNNLTREMGYWVDMANPYVTYESKYIESVWWLLKRIFDKGLLYKGYTIQPYSPAAGTGLSSHELNQPGCYKDVTDTTVVAQFKSPLTPEGGNKNSIKKAFNLNASKESVLAGSPPPGELEGAYFLAWTTTPWTLPSNTALAVGPKIDYVLVETFNQYTFLPVKLILAKELVAKQLTKPYFDSNSDEDFKNFNANNKTIPYKIIAACKGSNLIGIAYEQLLPYAQPYSPPTRESEGAIPSPSGRPGGAFRVIPGDFVTTEDGTGIVHIAPTFGADDARVAKEAGVPPMLVPDENETPVPLVDLQGRFRSEMGELAGKYVKNEYYPEVPPERSVDVEIAIKLKEENKAFKVEKYVHSYPHCWRTDKPVLYYPLDSWFIKVTEVKERMVQLNKTINWKPESTGTGRFGNWLENANDWNLSRSRYWGIPIPIWRTEDNTETICIGSAEQLKNECDKAVAAGFMENNPLAGFVPGDMSDQNYYTFDLHKNHVDHIILVSPSGKPMKRESDLIDVWFDSGSMPTAQLHYPFENKELIDNRKLGVADFIAEGVDQTRGWFYTLHAIATLCFDSVAYKNVISNGLVLDKKGQKMSKRLGNAVDPFKTLKTFGADATRWYLITNAQPWDNLKFDEEGITEVQRKFFRALHNTYSFFALYANIDGFCYQEEETPWENKTNIDRWILSKLNTLVLEVDQAYNDYEPTKAGRLIQDFVIDQLSNWYVRLCRRRFWKGDYSEDKITAYQTLYTCLITVAKLSSPIAPFYADQLYRNLNNITTKENFESVHLSFFPEVQEKMINNEMEERMDIAQKICSMVLGLRKKENIKVRQPLQKIMIPVLDPSFEEKVKSVEHIIKSETNVKEIEFLSDTSGILVKRIKPNFKTIGPRYGKHMKAIAGIVGQFGQKEISQTEQNNGYELEINGENIRLDVTDFEITSDDIPGWLVSTENGITVALDVTVSEELKQEGIAREFVNRIQNIRKESGFEVTDKVGLFIKSHHAIDSAIKNNLTYICSETLASSLELVTDVDISNSHEVEVDEGVNTFISIFKQN